MHVCAKVATGLLLAAVLCAGSPKKGPDLAARTDGVEPINEPCYVHDAACSGFPVCCVTKGTCVTQHSGTISSTTSYYEGGCQSKDSSRKTWSNPDCVQQGECLAQRLEVCKGGTTKAGFMTALPTAVYDRLMADSCERECASSWYQHNWGGGDDDSNTTITVTTTTTILTRVTKSFTLVISDVAAVQDAAQLEFELKSAVAGLAGLAENFAKGEVVVIVENFDATNAAEQSVTVHLDVSTSHTITHEDVKAALDTMTESQANAALAMRVGTCSYTMTMVMPGTSGAEAAGASGALQLLSATVVLWPLWSHGP